MKHAKIRMRPNCHILMNVRMIYLLKWFRNLCDAIIIILTLNVALLVPPQWHHVLYSELSSINQPTSVTTNNYCNVIAITFLT